MLDAPPYPAVSRRILLRVAEPVTSWYGVRKAPQDISGAIGGPNAPIQELSTGPGPAQAWQKQR